MAFYLPQTSKIEGSEVTLKAYQAADISVKYRDASGLSSSSKIVTGDKLRLDLSSGFDEQILTGSARFKVGLDTFLDRTGTLYRNVEPSNNSGIAVLVRLRLIHGHRMLITASLWSHSPPQQICHH